jgi:hypothetical protein
LARLFFRQNLQQWPGTDRDLAGEGAVVGGDQQYGDGDSGGKQAQCKHRTAPIVVVHHGDCQEKTDRLHEEA